MVASPARQPGCKRGTACNYACGVQSGVEERAWSLPLPEGAPETRGVPGGPGGSAHCEPARGPGAEGSGTEGGARTQNPLWPQLLPLPGGWPGMGRSRPGRLGASGWGPREAAVAPGGSTGALRQAAARAHLPAAALGRVIGCSRWAREIELSIHSQALWARTAVAELSPPALGRHAAFLRPEGAFSRRMGFSRRLRMSGPVAQSCSASTGSWRNLIWWSPGCTLREAGANCKKVPALFLLN